MTTAPVSAPGATSTNSLAVSDIRDIKPPVVIRDWTWVWWVLGALLLGAALGAWWWRRRKRATPAPVEVDVESLIPPHVRAKARLEEALALIGEPRAFCFAISDALRWYLEEQMDLRAPERTTEEFLEELRTSALLNIEHKEALAGFLNQSDLVKFAKHEPGEPELRELHAAALRFVVETEPSQMDASAETMSESQQPSEPSPA